jgi:hypothetical protein
MRSLDRIKLHRALVALLFAVVACSKDDAPEVEVLGAGPKVAELSFREDTAPAEAAPISLTGSDGHGLQLIAFEARAVIEDPLAFTELHLTFRNPEPRRREGRFEITLPPAAAISRFAMRTASGWQEGEVVERTRAQQVYEDFLHRKQDPALLEHDAGNEFTARVFPIEAGADKEIIISYSEERPLRSEPYRIALRGLPTLERFDVEVHLGASSLSKTRSEREGSGLLKVHERNYVPAADLQVRLPAARPFALRNGSLVLARVMPVAKVEPEEISGLTILFDTSASRALGFGNQIERTAELLADLTERMTRDFAVRFIAFDQDVEEIYRGSARSFSLRDKGKLLERGALGASDLEQALAYLAAKPDGHERVLLISDGVLTAGEDNTLRLREAVTKLSAHGVRRLDALVEGGIRDEATLHALTHAGLASAGKVLDARLSRSTLTDKLTRATRAKIAVHMPNANWFEPAAIEGAQAGDEFLIFADLPSGVPVQIELDDGTAQQIDTLDVSKPLIERAVARAKIDALTRRVHGLSDESEASKLRDEIIRLSVAQRVISEYTALLVLESADDYRRFGIEQRALGNILAVRDDGLTILDRQRPPLEIAADLAAKGEEEREADFGFREQPSADRPSAAPNEAIADDGTDEAKLDRRASGPAPSPASAPPPSQKSAVAEGDARKRTRAEPATQAATSPASLDLPLSGPAKARARGAGGVAGGALADQAATGLGRMGGAPVPHAPRIEERSRPELEIAAPTYVTSVSVRNSSFREAAGADAESAIRAALTRSTMRCYADREPPSSAQQLRLSFTFDERGAVTGLTHQGALDDGQAQTCVLTSARLLRIPKLEARSVQAEATLVVTRREQVANTTPTRSPRQVRRITTPEPAIEEAYDGVLANVLSALRRQDVGTALVEAKRAHARDPSDVMALVALGETLEAQQDHARAARVYGSLVDLFPSRADMRRMAGARLERLSRAHLPLAIDSYRRAALQRPDHPSGHRLLAYALLKHDEPSGAFEVLQNALARSYPSGRFLGVEQILREDLGLVAAAWLRAKPGDEEQIRARLAASGAVLDTSPSLRFVLSWETDANDVDFHIYDGRGGHASYMQPRLNSGGKLYADVTTGYGPECFAIAGKARAYPYTLQAHYFQRGPMGYGMGKLQVVEHDGHGVLKFAEHPFVIMKDKAFVALARLDGPLAN